MIKTLVGIFIWGLCAATSAKAALANYTFTSSETDVPIVPDLVFSPFSRANVSPDLLAGAFRSSAWNLG